MIVRLVDELVVDAIQRSGKDIPWDCLETSYNSTLHRSRRDNDPMKRLLTSSLRFEEEVLPEWSQISEIKQNHIDEFNSALERKKFCNWNVQELVQWPEIQDVCQRAEPTLACVTQDCRVKRVKWMLPQEDYQEEESQGVALEETFA